MMVRPMNDRIFVKRLDVNQTGMIEIPDIAKEKPGRGKVLAVGPGKLGKHGGRIPVSVKPGDIIHFGKYVDFEQDGYVMVQDGDVLVVENAAA